MNERTEGTLWIVLWLCAVVLAFSLATANAGDIFLTPYSAEQTTSPCPLNPRTSSNHPFATLDCPDSGTPGFVFHVFWPVSAGATWQAVVYSRSDTATFPNSICWTVETAHHEPGSTWTTGSTFGSAVNVLDTTTGANEMSAGYSATFTPYSSTFSSACTTPSACQGDPLVVRVRRNNACSTPVSGNIQFLGLRLNF